MKAVVAVVLALSLVVGQATAQSTGGHSSPVLLPADGRTIDSLRVDAKGRVLLLNFWATWCKPCIEEFPHLVKLQRTYAARGLDLVFISVDDDDAKTSRRVRAFLQNMNVASPSFLKVSGDDEAFINAVHPRWSGAVPATFVYDRRGKLAAMTVEEMNLDELEKLILPLLDQ